MENLNVISEKVFVDLTVKSMLNKNNKDFYICELTIDKVKSLLNGMDNKAICLFWKAFGIAQADYVFNLVRHGFPTDALEDRLDEIELSFICPECCCRDYIPDVACPNCDYVEC